MVIFPKNTSENHSLYLVVKYIFSASHILGNGLGAGNINMSKIEPRFGDIAASKEKEWE